MSACVFDWFFVRHKDLRLIFRKQNNIVLLKVFREIPILSKVHLVRFEAICGD